MANGEHPISGLMNVTLEKIRQMVDSNTIIGDPISTADGSTILPVSKVSFGFASGGSDFVSGKAPKDLFGGGSGAGVSIQPVAFLVLKDDNVKLLQLADKSGTVDRALNMLPEVMDKVQGIVSGGAGGGEEEPAAPAPEAGKGKARRFGRKAKEAKGKTDPASDTAATAAAAADQAVRAACPAGKEEEEGTRYVPLSDYDDNPCDDGEDDVTVIEPLL